MGYIREYTVIPALEKLEFEIVALNFLSVSIMPEQVKEIHEWVSKNPKILFSSSGEGLNGKALLLVSLKTDVIKHFSFKDLERI